MRRSGFGEPLRRQRQQHGLTQQDVADELIKLAWSQKKTHVGVDRQMVSKWEREAKFPDRIYRDLLCTLYGSTDHDLGFRAVASETSVSSQLVLPSANAQFESPLDIAERMQAFLSTNVNDDAVVQLEQIVTLVVDDYESSGPAELVGRVVRQRRIVDELMAGKQLPKQRDRLYATAAKLSAMLGYMAVNLGKFSVADSYSREAFAMAEMIGDTETQAWVRGTESFCAYYRSDYQRAVDLARDGLRYAQGGPQAVRLAVNGEARALGKLGDQAGVAKAIELAYDVSDRFESQPGLSPCISFEIYGRARTAANAVTAYVALGLPKEVEEYSQQVTPVMDASDSRWTQSLVRLDTATAMVLMKRPEPEQAAQLVTEALTISADRPITSVLTRSREFLEVASRWHELPALVEAAETLKAATKR